MTTKTLSIAVKSIIALAIFALISAYYIEYILNIKPCVLCIYQRIPYFLIVISTLILLIKNYKKYLRYLLMFYFITFISSFFLSLYHVGIERGFIEESAIKCTVKQKSIPVTREELKKQITTNKDISCKNISFRIAGLSIAEINLVVSIIVISSIIVILKRR